MVMRKGSIQVSVNILVVMIIGLALLGVGVALMGDFIGIASKMREKVSAEHKEQLVRVLDSGARVAAFPTRITTTKKGKADFSIGISNELGRAGEFSISVEEYFKNPVLSNPDDKIEVLYIKGPYKIANNKRVFVSVRIVLPRSVVPGSYLFNVYVCNVTDPDLCNKQNFAKYGYGEPQRLQVNVR